MICVCRTFVQISYSKLLAFKLLFEQVKTCFNRVTLYVYVTSPVIAVFKTIFVADFCRRRALDQLWMTWTLQMMKYQENSLILVTALSPKNTFASSRKVFVTVVDLCSLLLSCEVCCCFYTASSRT